MKLQQQGNLNIQSKHEAIFRVVVRSYLQKIVNHTTIALQKI